MTEHKHAEVLRAIADGKEVEYQDSVGDWQIVHGVNPINFPSLKWRVKPEPKPDVVQELILYEVTGIGGIFPIGLFRIVKDGETSKLKSAEVLE